MKVAKISTKATIEDFNNDKKGNMPVKKFSGAVAWKKVNVSEAGSANSTQDGTGYLSEVDTDLSNLFLCLQGRVRFGDGVSGARSENIAGEFRTVTTAGANTEVVVPHTLGEVPIGRIVLRQDKAGHIYDSTTAWTKTNIYIKCDVASVTFKLFLVK